MSQEPSPNTGLNSSGLKSKPFAKGKIASFSRSVWPKSVSNAPSPSPPTPWRSPGQRWKKLALSRSSFDPRLPWAARAGASPITAKSSKSLPPQVSTPPPPLKSSWRSPFSVGKSTKWRLCEITQTTASLSAPLKTLIQWESIRATVSPLLLPKLLRIESINGCAMPPWPSFGKSGWKQEAPTSSLPFVRRQDG